MKRWIPLTKTIAVDTFERANSGTLGANWTDAVAGFGIVSNQASATQSGAAIVAYSATTPISNARMSITLRTTPTANIVVVLFLRYDLGAGDGYAVKYDGTTLKIDEDAGGVSGTLASNGTAFANGDVISFSAYGSILTVYKNGVSVLTATDGSYTTPFNATIGFVPTGTQTFAFDNFVLQNL